VFFYWLCLYFYERAKRLGASDTPAQHRLFGLAGACLGLMLASKYFPNYWAMLFLFFHFLGRNESNQPLSRRDYLWFYGAFAAAFLVFNPTVLLPSTLEYFIAYLHEKTVTHHGYVLMGRLYANNFSVTPGGLPLYFYPLLLGLKTPLAVLGASVGGLAVAVRRRRQAGYFFLTFMFVLWIVPYSVFAAKWYRYVLSFLPILYLAAAVGAAEIARVAVARSRRPEAFSHVLVATVAGGLVVVPPASAASSAPFYSLYLNALGRGEPGSYFPHDEFYDAGLREAVGQVCAEAPPGAVVFGEAPPVFDYYKRRFGREDIQFFQLSERAAVAAAPPPDYVIVQDGRIYFENVDYVRWLEATRSPESTIRVGGAVAERIFRLGGSAAASPTGG
jgi:hypothetical protein